MAESRVQPITSASPGLREVPGDSQILRTIESEHDLLRAMLMNGEMAASLLRSVDVSMLEDPSSRSVVSTMIDLAQLGVKLGPHEVMRRMQDLGTIGALKMSMGPGQPLARGAGFFSHLLGDGWTVADPDEALRRFRVLHARKSIQRAFGAVAGNAAQTGGLDLGQLVLDAEEALTELKSAQSADQYPDDVDVEASILESLDRGTLSERRVPTGLVGLDAALGGGLASPGMVMLAGQTGSGKSTLATFIAYTLSLVEPVFVFGLEMTPGQNSSRVMSMRSGVAAHKIANPSKLSAEERMKLLALAVGPDSNRHLRWAGLETRDLGAIENVIRREVKRGYRVFFVDHVKLVEVRDDRGRMEYDQVKSVALAGKRLSALAMKLNVLIVAVGQLKRDKARSGELPSDDWVYGGSIIDDAHQILILRKKDGKRELSLVKDRTGAAQEFSIWLGLDGESSRPRIID